MAVVDHYKVLGVNESSTADQIKKAYRNLAKQYHPDKNKQPGAEEKFKAIASAYAVLSDSDKRRTYDLQRPTAAEKKRPNPNREPSSSSSTGWARFRTSNQPPETGANNFHEFFTTGDSTNFYGNRSSFGTTGTRSQKKGTRSHQAGRRKSSPAFSFQFGKPGWNNDLFDDAFEDLDRAFEDLLKTTQNMFERSSKFFPSSPPFSAPFSAFSCDDDDPNEEWFDVSSGLKTKPTQDRTKSTLDDMWDWSVPMFKNKPFKGTSRFGRKDGDLGQVKLPCIHCGRVMSPSELHGHEEVCGHFFTPRNATKTGDKSSRHQHRTSFAF